jgi:hypothetical protein
MGRLHNQLRMVYLSLYNSKRNKMGSLVMGSNYETSGGFAIPNQVATFRAGMFIFKDYFRIEAKVSVILNLDSCFYISYRGNGYFSRGDDWWAYK